MRSMVKRKMGTANSLWVTTESILSEVVRLPRGRPFFTETVVTRLMKR